MEVNLQRIIEAKERIAPYIQRTPLIRAASLDEILGCQVYLKPENLQKTGAFKIRGAMNKLLTLSQEEQKKGVIAASSGNHGQAVALAARLLKLPAVIVVPEDINQVKLSGIKDQGATAILHGKTSKERYQKVDELIEAHGYTLIHSYDDVELISGQGTVGLEIIEDFPEIDTVISPLGGGGLLSGVATAIKAHHKGIKIIGVEPVGVSRYTQSLKENRIVEVEMRETLADGLRVVKPGNQNFVILKKYLDSIALVDDAQIKEAIGLLLMKARLLVEPSGAVGVGALLGGSISVRKDERVCLILSGGNIDKGKLMSLL